MTKAGTKKNYFYTIVKEAIDVAVPLILVPYSSRILGVDGIGQYSYVYSIVYYFMIVSMLGLNNYGTREIAKSKGLERQKKVFGEIYALQLASCAIMTLIFGAIAFSPGNNYRLVFMAQLAYVLSCFFDVAWFFMGIEKFRIITACNALAKVVSLVLVLVFVKEPNDLVIYCTILSGCVLLGNIALWAFMKRKIGWRISQLDFTKIKAHFKPCLILFIPIIAMKIYKVMDKTTLGVLSTMDEVGYYSNADSIVNVPMGIVIALGLVMLPRLTNLLSEKSHDEAKRLFRASLEFGVFIIVPIMLGLIVLGPSIAILFLGNDFARTGSLLQIIAITMLFMTVANIIRTQILIPRGMDKEFSKSVIIGAIVNLIGNFILIPVLNANGACISTILAEFLVMAMSIYYARSDVDLKFLVKKIMFALLSGSVMAVIVFVMSQNMMLSWANLLIQVGVGAMIYFALNFEYISTAFQRSLLKAK